MEIYVRERTRMIIHQFALLDKISEVIKLLYTDVDRHSLTLRILNQLEKFDFNQSLITGIVCYQNLKLLLLSSKEYLSIMLF
jgi:hypothetical protein